MIVAYVFEGTDYTAFECAKRALLDNWTRSGCIIDCVQCHSHIDDVK
jgi:DNA primase large subunit